jgi:hypothetical protein
MRLQSSGHEDRLTGPKEKRTLGSTIPQNTRGKAVCTKDNSGLRRNSMKCSIGGGFRIPGFS